MTNYEQDTLALIPGETPRAKYEWVKNMVGLKERLIERRDQLDRNESEYTKENKPDEARCAMIKSKQFDTIIRTL